MRLSVGSPGMFTTVQDLGRYGCRSRGVPVAGAMDGPALRLGNILLGNDEGAAALEGFRGIKGRGRILPAAGREGFVVDDAYNANPLSMRSSLETFLSLRSVTPKMAVLGEMREMGPDAVRYHRELEPLIDGVDEAVLVGELWRGALEEKPNRRFVGGWREALDAARAAEWAGSLVKGSNSLELERVVEGLAAEPVSSDGPGEAS